MEWRKGKEVWFGYSKEKRRRREGVDKSIVKRGREDRKGGVFRLK